MDVMFNNGIQTSSKNNGHTLMTPEDNDIIVDVVDDDNGDSGSSPGTSQASMNKRKIGMEVLHNTDQSCNNDKNTKRLCTMNGHH
jgi:hypothetical protein